MVSLAWFSLMPMAAVATTSSCNPLSSTSCSADKALATSFIEDFTEESDYFSAVSFPDRINYTSEGASLTLAERFDNPALKSNFYIMFGKLQVTFKAAPGRGVVSSFYLQSDDLDEIDLEWIGSDITEVQTNYFSKGNTSTYDRGSFHPVSSPQTEYHNYTIDWTESALTWYIDGVSIRTISSDVSSGYPQTPMYIVTGIWAGGDPSNAAGTIEWAGGLVDYSEAPFTMHVKDMIVSDYSTGSEYSYSDQSGTWESITAVDGAVNGRITEAQEEFAALANGSGSTGSSSSSSLTERSESSQDENASSSNLSSNSSSNADTETIYSSGASTLVVRSESSSGTTAITESAGNSGITTSTINSVSSTSNSSAIKNSTSASTSATVLQSNSGSVSVVIGANGLKALFASIAVTLSVLIAM